MGEDSGGIFFHFNSENNHYTIRFAWKPLLYLEYLYKKRGGENFEEEYKKLINKTSRNLLLRQSVKDTIEMFEVIKDINTNNKSFLVIYSNKLWMKK